MQSVDVDCMNGELGGVYSAFRALGRLNIHLGFQTHLWSENITKKSTYLHIWCYFVSVSLISAQLWG